MIDIKSIPRDTDRPTVETNPTRRDCSLDHDRDVPVCLELGRLKRPIRRFLQWEIGSLISNAKCTKMEDSESRPIGGWGTRGIQWGKF